MTSYRSRSKSRRPTKKVDSGVVSCLQRPLCVVVVVAALIVPQGLSYVRDKEQSKHLLLTESKIEHIHEQLHEQKLRADALMEELEKRGTITDSFRKFFGFDKKE